MKLFKLTRTDVVGYDEFDSLVVVANTEEKAIAITPDYGWTTEDRIEVEYIGTAKRSSKEGIILGSYNAG